MRLRLGRPRVALVVAPHPDDETIGAFGLIRRLRALGTRVRVIVVTDGGASHPGSRLWSRQRLARAREAETLQAMRALGIGRGAVRFLRLPDGRLPAEAQACRAGLGRAVRRMSRLDLLVGPVGDDDHADHRATAAALAATRLPGVRRLHYKVWPIGRQPRRAATLPLDARTCSAKRRAVRGYRTQRGLIRDDPAGFAMSARQIAAFTRPRELFTEGPG